MSDGKLSRGNIVFMVCIFVFIIALAILCLHIIVKDYNENNKIIHNLYSDNCERLGSKVVEPVEGYYLENLCYITQDNITTFYKLSNMSGQITLVKWKGS